jgi:hypothetical protein
MRGNLSEAKRRLLEQRLKGGAINSSGSKLDCQPPQEISPYLSYAQERLWFLAQLQPDSSASIMDGR